MNPCILRAAHEFKTRPNSNKKTYCNASLYSCRWKLKKMPFAGGWRRGSAWSATQEKKFVPLDRRRVVGGGGKRRRNFDSVGNGVAAVAATTHSASNFFFSFVHLSCRKGGDWPKLGFSDKAKRGETLFVAPSLSLFKGVGVKGITSKSLRC